MIAPAYTGQLPRSLEGVQQRLLGLPGTRLSLGFTFSKDLESAEITWDDGQTLPLEVTGRFVTAGLVHTQARRAQVQVRDVHGLTLDEPLLIDFDLQVDEKPQVLLPKHLTDDMPLLAEAVPMFGFAARVQDDYGVTRCLLRWQKSTVDNPTTIVEQGEVERLISPSQRTAVVNFENVFEGLQVQPGDKVSFDVEPHPRQADCPFAALLVLRVPAGSWRPEYRAAGVRCGSRHRRGADRQEPEGHGGEEPRRPSHHRAGEERVRRRREDTHPGTGDTRRIRPGHAGLFPRARGSHL
jgi:hypothetical protein